MSSDAFAAGILDAALLMRPATPSPTPDGAAIADARKAAQDFEAFFLSQTFEAMQAGLETPAPFGGGSGEKMWRSFLSQAMADAMVVNGGIGLADRLTSELITLQTQDF